MEEHEKQEQIFDLTGGLLCLDFANTLDDRTEIHPQELLVNFNDLVSWSKQAQVLTEQEARQLLEKAAKHPPEDCRASCRRK